MLSVAVSPNGKRVASGSMDGSVSVFDVATGKYLHKCEGHAMPVRSLAFTPDSRVLLTCSDDMHIHMYVNSFVHDSLVRIALVAEWFWCTGLMRNMAR